MDDKIEELKKKVAALERELNKDKGKNVENSQRPEREKFVPMKILLAWKAPSRVFVLRDKAWFLKIASLALLFILFFAFLQDFIVILVICIIVLVLFLLASIPPDKVEHEITTKGIKSIGTLYNWKDLRSFFLAEKLGSKIVYIKTKIRFPSQLMMIIKAKDEMKTVKLLMEKLDFEEYKEKQGWLSKISEGEIVIPDKYLKAFKRENREGKNQEKD